MLDVLSEPEVNAGSYKRRDEHFNDTFPWSPGYEPSHRLHCTTFGVARSNYARGSAHASLPIDAEGGAVPGEPQVLAGGGRAYQRTAQR